MSVEDVRLEEDRQRTRHWRRWGPYLSDRAWGTVREDYSPHGTAWDSFPHDMARSRAYRWGEDGLAGLSDHKQRLCLALAVWNMRDAILKERLFGVTGPEGNHGEDVKEIYYYLDAVPSHAWLRMLYKYPQAAFPYAELVAASRARGKADPEFELIDTGVFDDDRYFDIVVEYAKHGPDDLVMRVRVVNRGPDDAPIVVMPQAWFRNTWAWGRWPERPSAEAVGEDRVTLTHPSLGSYVLHADQPDELAFCENDTNLPRLFGHGDPGYFKDGLHDFIVHGRREAVNPARQGTKVGIVWRRTIPAGGEAEFLIRLAPEDLTDPFGGSAAVLDARRAEADAFYESVHPEHLSADERHVQRQALAGMIWSQQYYYYDVPQWLDGDPAQPAPPPERKSGRNHEWRHLNNANVISMPDAWEYPWYAAWDLAFHCVPYALVDVHFAKRQLLLLTREWYMHPNGQLPAYEWALGDVNPPVHAWAVWQVYRIDSQVTGTADSEFLEKAFHKLLLNFTWWVNRKDRGGRNVFQGGFLGLDNIGVFDRSKPLPTGGHLDQADGTAWMGMYALNMLMIALELARTKPAYEDVATKFFEHFVYIANAINGSSGHGLWNEEDGFYYDVLHFSTGEHLPLRIRSFVGLIPLFAVEVLDLDLLDHLPRFKQRVEWFINYRGHMMQNLSLLGENDGTGWLLSLVNRTQLARVLTRMLDPRQFLSDYGLRALSREHKDHPFTFSVGGQTYAVSYEPAESTTGLFGGNSNWRGPIWFPVNYLMIEALRTFGGFYGDTFKVEMPTGSGVMMRIDEAADAIARRLTQIFLADASGRRPFAGDNEQFQTDPLWKDHLLFYEYFHGDSGAGLGASHQTGWTALVAQLLQEVTALSPSREEQGRPHEAQALLPLSSL